MKLIIPAIILTACIFSFIGFYVANAERCRVDLNAYNQPITDSEVEGIR